MSLKSDAKRTYLPVTEVSAEGRTLHDALWTEINRRGPIAEALWWVCWSAETLRERSLPDSNAPVVIDGSTWRYAAQEEINADRVGEASKQVVSPARYCEIRFGLLSEEWRLSRFVDLASEALLERNTVAAIQLGTELYEYFTVQRVYRITIARGHKFTNKRPEAANRQRARDASSRARQVLEAAREYLQSGRGRFATGRINVSDLARHCERQVKNVGRARIREMLREADRRGELNITPTSQAKS